MLLSPAPNTATHGLEVGGDALNPQLYSWASEKVSVVKRGTYLKLQSVKWGQFLPTCVCLFGNGGDGIWGRGKHFAKLQDTKVGFTNTLDHHIFI